MRAFLDLLAPHLDAAVPIALLLQSPELARAVGVAALADRQVSVLLAEVHLAVERGDGWGPYRVAPPRYGPSAVAANAPQHRIERGYVRRLGAAAAADQADTVFEHKAFEPLRELGCAERVMRATVDELRQAGIGLHRDVPGPVLAEPFDVLGHFARPGRAIEPDDRHVERADDRCRGGDVGADQQRPGSFDRHADKDWNVLAGVVAGAFGAVGGGLDLQRILASLDRDRVDAAGDEPGTLQREPVLELLVGDMAERRKPGAWSERAEHEAGAAVMGEIGDRLARQFGGAPVQLERALGDAELPEGDRRAPEAVGLQCVATGFEIAAMDLADQVRAAVAQNLGAVLETEKVALDVEIARLNLSPHRAVTQHDPIGEVVEEMGHPRVYACDPNSSPPRKRGSRVSGSELAALGSRFRGNDE